MGTNAEKIPGSTVIFSKIFWQAVSLSGLLALSRSLFCNHSRVALSKGKLYTSIFASSSKIFVHQQKVHQLSIVIVLVGLSLRASLDINIHKPMNITDI